LSHPPDGAPGRPRTAISAIQRAASCSPCSERGCVRGHGFSNPCRGQECPCPCFVGATPSMRCRASDTCPPIRRSAMKPETILPHSGRRLVRTLALQIMSIMLIMSKKWNLKPSTCKHHPFARHVVAGEGARAPTLCSLFHQKRMIFALLCH
jgi:hypothetical protein